MENLQINMERLAILAVFESSDSYTYECLTVYLDF